MITKIFMAIGVSVLILTQTTLAAVVSVEEQKQKLISACNWLVQNPVVGIFSEANSAEVLARYEAMEFICNRAGKSVEFVGTVGDSKKYLPEKADTRVKVDAMLKMSGQPGCAEFIHIGERDLKIKNEDLIAAPYEVGGKAHGLAVLADELQGACSNNDQKQALHKLRDQARHIETVAMGYYQCEGKMEAFNNTVKQFEQAYFQKVDLTGEQGYERALKSAKELQEANCPGHIPTVNQRLQQMDAMLKDPQRAEKVQCQKSSDAYIAKKSEANALWKKKQLDVYDLESIVSPSLEKAKKDCRAFPPQVNNLDNNFNEYLRFYQR